METQLVRVLYKYLLLRVEERIIIQLHLSKIAETLLLTVSGNLPRSSIKLHLSVLIIEVIFIRDHKKVYFVS